MMFRVLAWYPKYSIINPRALACGGSEDDDSSRQRTSSSWIWRSTSFKHGVITTMQEDDVDWISWCTLESREARLRTEYGLKDDDGGSYCNKMDTQALLFFFQHSTRSSSSSSRTTTRGSRTVRSREGVVALLLVSSSSNRTRHSKIRDSASERTGRGERCFLAFFFLKVLLLAFLRLSFTTVGLAGCCWLR
jgi:hypothetical protein